jgi:hypothetical protein
VFIVVVYFVIDSVRKLLDSPSYVKVKGKVDPVLLTEHHVKKAYCGSGGIAPRIL